MNAHRRTVLHHILPLLIFVITSAVYGQNASIIGKVINAEERVPLENVSVEISDMAIRVSTNEKGVFEIRNLTSGYYTLTISRIGFRTFKTTLNVGVTNVNVDISLYPEPINMNEVVVSGYREIYKAGDNYSASRINAPMMMLPLSTGQVTGKLIDDQNILNVNEALRNISGVAVEFGGPAHPMVVNIRDLPLQSSKMVSEWVEQILSHLEGRSSGQCLKC